MDNTSMREALEAARNLLLPQCNGGTAFAKACGETVNKIMDAMKEKRASDGNAAAMREAVIETQSVIAKCMDILNKIPDGCGYGGLIDDVADELCDLREEHIKAALSAPPRNCDRFGGDIEKLREACARERGLNPEEDFLDVFPDWLLAPIGERVTLTEGGK